MKSLVRYLLAIHFVALSVRSQNTASRGQVPIPGKPVYIPQTNSLWIFSFSKNVPADNKLASIDLNQSFDTRNPPVVDKSKQITNNGCPVMHFAQALRSSDGVSVNVFGAGSDINGVYQATMTLCQFNTMTGAWKQVIKPNNATPARRNSAFEITQSGLTLIWGGSSEVITGLMPNQAGYPLIWHQDVSIYDNDNGWLSGPTYNGPTRVNATMTQISDTNGQLVIIGGATINNSSAIDMVTNFPLANMSDIIVVDPRTSHWSNIGATGNAPIPRKHHTATLHPDGHTIIVIGGEYFDSYGAYLLNDVWTLDTRNANNYTWTKPVISGEPGLFRSNHTSILIKDQIWVIAGTNASAKAVDIQLLNVTSWTWSYNAVSTFVPPGPYASIGGIKGLIGIVVGAVGGCLLLAFFVYFWWCRRKRVDPKKQPATSYAYTKNEESEDHHQQMLEQRRSFANVYDPLNLDTSKIISRPSVSTTTSGGLTAGALVAAGDWQRTNSFGINTTMPTSQALTNSYYVPQYTVPHPISPDQQYYNGDHYYNDSNNNYFNGAEPDYTTVGRFGSTTTGAIYSHDNNHRQSLGYWDNTSPQPQPFSPDLTQYPDHMLTPINNEESSSWPKIQQPQQLQKPNEVDFTNLPTSPVAGSTTVYTSSTNEESVTSNDHPSHNIH